MATRELRDVVTTFHKYRELREFMGNDKHWNKWIDVLKKNDGQPTDVAEFEEKMHKKIVDYLRPRTNILEFAFEWAVCSPDGLTGPWGAYLLFKDRRTQTIFIIRQGSAEIVTDWAELGGDNVQLACYRNTARSSRSDEKPGRRSLSTRASS
jgi:hypothetical protein